jgi:pimeloyl-ACP methyl ester carboxylesterase
MDTQTTAPTRFVQADSTRFAYRRFGQERGTPLVFFQHFRGSMDTWDPAVTDGFAGGRPVILFNNAGVSSSSGRAGKRLIPLKKWPMTPPISAAHSGSRKLTCWDSPWGGYVAQTLALNCPTLISI